MLYQRLTLDGKPVSEDQMVGANEHLLTTQRVICLDGVFAGSSTASNYLLALDSLSHDRIVMMITSPGGELDSAFLLYDTMKLIQSPVYTLGRYCASAAALLLAAGDKRYLMPHAKIMLHLPSGQLMGDATEVDIQHEQMLLYKAKIVEILRECGVSRSDGEILKDIDRNFWLEPQEAIDYGLADEVVTAETLSGWLS